nr:DUF4123 domain-containing protein [Aquabacterium sp.]
MASLLDIGTPCFVLVDPMLGEPLPMSYEPANVDQSALVASREQAWMRPVHQITLARPISLPLHLHPYLVALNGASDPLLAATVEMALDELSLAQADGVAGTGASAHRIGGWLLSSQTPDELAQAISALMQVNTEASTTARYQRLADRRALDLLLDVVGEARIATHLGRIQRWCYLDPCRKLRQLRSTSEAATPLRLSRTEWASFIKGDLLHPTVARWLGEQPATSRHATQSCYAKSTVALEQADAAMRRWPQRFANASDRIAWAVLTLLHGDIQRMPAIVASLDAATQPGEPLETLNALSPLLHAMCLKATS